MIYLYTKEQKKNHANKKNQQLKMSSKVIIFYNGCIIHKSFIKKYQQQENEIFEDFAQLETVRAMMMGGLL